MSFCDQALWERLKGHTVNTTAHYKFGDYNIQLVHASRSLEHNTNFDKMAEEGTDVYVMSTNGESSYLGMHSYHAIRLLIENFLNQSRKSLLIPLGESLKINPSLRDEQKKEREKNERKKRERENEEGKKVKESKKRKTSTYTATVVTNNT